MKKKVLKTTFLLLLISGISKLLSFAVRITLARQLSDEALNCYSLASSVLMFLITISNFGIPNALTQLVASKKEVHSSVSASIALSFVNNLLLCIIAILGIPLYARFVLKQDILIPVLYACVPMLPMVMVTGLIKGYFMGRQKMILSSSAQITEEVFRLGFLLLFSSSFSQSPVLMAAFAILSQTVGEIGSCLHLGLALIFHHGDRLHLYLIPEFHKDALIELLSLSVPMTAARMIGSLTAFLEPVVMLNTAQGATDIYVQVYSHMNAYVLPLITLPSFFSIAISGWVLPAFSEAYGRNETPKAKTIFLVSTFFCIGIGLSFSLLLFFFSEPICQLLYHQTEMAPLVKMLSLPFSLYAAQPVFTAMLHGAKKSTRAMMDTTAGCLVRLISLMMLCHAGISQASAIALILSSLVTTLLHFQACLSLFVDHHKSAFGPQRKKNL